MSSQGANQGGNGSGQGGRPRSTGAGPGKAGRPERAGGKGPGRPGAGGTGSGGTGNGGPGKAGRPDAAGGKSFAGKPREFAKARSGAAGGKSFAGKGAAPERSRSDARTRPLPPGARGRALWLLNQVLIEGQTLATALPKATEGLEPGEAARAGRLATETLRQMSRADRLLSPYLRLKPAEPVMNLLRLATVELARGGAAHGVVHAAVNLSRMLPETQQAAGLANAVLRRVSEHLRPLEEMPVPMLPKPLRKQLVTAWGKEAVAAMEQVFTETPPTDLTAKADAAALAAATGGSLLPGGSVRLAGAPQISALPGYETGDFWVQDAAAALPARVLEPQPGEAILDLCAAPGGKTMQLAAAGARVTALDVSAERMQRVGENLARTGLSAELVVADGLTWENPAPFDAILLDAPCSATGTIRRHPDLPHVRGEADLAPLLELQARLFDRAVQMLRPGGRLVFCTCSLLPEEGEAQALAALERLPELERDPAAVAALGIDPAWSPAPGEIRTRPDFLAAQGGIDGFYIAAFRKRGGSEG